MDRQVVEQKLESLRRCLHRVHTRCPADLTVLETDFDLQDIVALNLSRAVQLCVDIAAHCIATAELPAPATMGQTFGLLAQVGIIDAELAARLKKAVGFRNIAMHNYDAIDWRIVHSIVQHNLQDFSNFARAVMTALEARS
ncbi:DUF86 domain-containing protein [Magnetovirga frankeli]|uniref:type VII toxin-antitoxin system HepT family RNase toxin n=1 Tax=Magnetovirga frankeli TaxID=947516 RepID=UPI0012938D64|nr:DUF86 domain-containing protein [gamma proteobacterium SS-5]